MNKKLKIRLELLSRLGELTRNHDWSYALSNDPKRYNTGHLEARAIELLMEECANNNLSILAKDVYNDSKPK